jgi:hypothetical protein
MYLIAILLRNYVKFGRRKPNTGAVFIKFAKQREAKVSGGRDPKIANDCENIVYSSGVRTRNVPLPRAMRSLR